MNSLLLILALALPVPAHSASGPDRLTLDTSTAPIKGTRHLRGKSIWYNSADEPKVFIDGETGEIEASGLIKANCGVRYFDGTTVGGPSSGNCGDGGVTPPPSGCTNNGGACTTGGTCCSGICTDLVCAAAPPPPIIEGATTYTEPFVDYDYGTCLAVSDQFGPWTVKKVDGTSCAKVLQGSTSSYLDMTTQAGENQQLIISADGITSSLPYEYSAQLRTRVQTDTTPDNADRGALIFQYLDNNRFYYFMEKANGWELGKVTSGSPFTATVLLNGTYAATALGAASSTVTIKQDGNGTITAYKGSHMILVYQDTSSPYSGGRVGFWSKDAAAEFTNAQYNVSISTVDAFGTARIYKSLRGGKEWTSQWHQGGARTWDAFEFDPIDPWHLARGSGAGGAQSVTDGDGILKVQGSVVRQHVRPPFTAMRQVTSQWRHFEFTNIFRRRRAIPSGNAFSGMVFGVRGNHGVYSTPAIGCPESSNPDGEVCSGAITTTTCGACPAGNGTGNNCSFSCDSRGYYVRLRADGDSDFFKETAHPNGTSTSGLRAGTNVWTDGNGSTGGWEAIPEDEWIAFKVVARDTSSGNVVLEQFMSSGTGSGYDVNWCLLNSFTDNGSNFGSGASDCLSCSAISTTLRYDGNPTRQGSITGMPNLLAYWRFDGDGTTSDPRIMEYQKATFREIDNAGGTPTYNAGSAPPKCGGTP